jgi:hypothetical protein
MVERGAPRISSSPRAPTIRGAGEKRRVAHARARQHQADHHYDQVDAQARLFAKQQSRDGAEALTPGVHRIATQACDHEADSCRQTQVQVAGEVIAIDVGSGGKAQVESLL